MVQLRVTAPSIALSKRTRMTSKLVMERQRIQVILTSAQRLRILSDLAQESRDGGTS